MIHLDLTKSLGKKDFWWAFFLLLSCSYKEDKTWKSKGDYFQLWRPHWQSSGVWSNVFYVIQYKRWFLSDLSLMGSLLLNQSVPAMTHESRALRLVYLKMVCMILDNCLCDSGVQETSFSVQKWSPDGREHIWICIVRESEHKEGDLTFDSTSLASAPSQPHCPLFSRKLLLYFSPFLLSGIHLHC